jgi:allantoinase
VIGLDRQLTRVIANGTVAAPYGTFRAHVVVAGERIAAFSDDDGVLTGADEVIDADGLVVLPGSVDLHVRRRRDTGRRRRRPVSLGPRRLRSGRP